MPLPIGDQRVWRRRLIEEALGRLGGLEAITVEEPLAPSTELRYRNKVEFALRTRRAAAPELGLRAAEDPRRIVEVDSCLLQSVESDAVLSVLREALTGVRESPGVERRVVIRRSSADGKILVAFEDLGRALPGAREIARRLVASCPGVVGVVRVVRRAAQRGDARVVPLAGRDRMVERIAGLSFDLPATTFVQVNPDGAEALVDLVAACAQPFVGDRVLELYAGVGLYGMHLRRCGAGRTTIVEADRAAIASGRRAARQAGLGGVIHRAGDVARALEMTEPGSVDLVVANPPRSGFGRGVANGILRVAPRRIVVVSCDPPTLARDLAALTRGGYHVTRIAPLDLFPQTSHVECVVRLDLAPGRAAPA